MADQAGQILFLAMTDFQQRVPKLGFQAHAGAAPVDQDVAVEKATARPCPWEAGGRGRAGSGR
jgi:hypothetical protein